MSVQLSKKLTILPPYHMAALIACSFLVLFVALWPNDVQSTLEAPTIVNLPPVPIRSLTQETELTMELSSETSELWAPTKEEDPSHTIKTEIVGPGDTLSTIFERSGAGVSVLYKLLSHDEIKTPLEKIYPGQEFDFTYQNNALNKIHFNESALISYTIALNEGEQFTIDKIEREPEIYTRHTKAIINDSLFLDGKKAGLTDSMIMQLATIFGWDIDFVLDIRQGDSFSLIYEENFLDGKKLSDGPIVAAKFINNGREVSAFRFTDKDGRTDYFAANGDSMRKAFLRTPLDVFRVSSSFNLNRKHPILNKIVAHKGTDYAAPTGTPIKAAGKGKVIKAHKSATYGNVVVLQHGNNIRTLYAHMNNFAKNLKVGQRVKQGQVIGFVGATGRATGPHLHYEFQVNGVHKNPQTVTLPNAQPLKSAYLDEFKQFTGKLNNQLNAIHATQTAKNGE